MNEVEDQTIEALMEKLSQEYDVKIDVHRKHKEIRILLKD